MHEPILHELDALVATGALREDESLEYLGVLDECPALELHARAVGRTFVDDLVHAGKLDYYLERNFRRFEKTGRMDPAGGVFALFTAFKTMIDGQFAGVERSFRIAAAQTLLDAFDVHLVHAIDRRLSESDALSPKRLAFLRLALDCAGKPNDLDWLADALDAILILPRALASSDVAMPACRLSDAERTTIVKDLRSFVVTRRVPTQEFSVGPVDITLLGDEIPEFRAHSWFLGALAFARVSLTPAARATMAQDGVPASTLDDCAISRSDGALTPREMGVPYADYASRDTFLNLENAILLRLWEALSAQPDVFARPEVRLSTPDSSESDAIVGATREALDAGGLLPLPDPNDGAALDAPSTEGPSPFGESADDAPRVVTRRRAPRGLRASDVLRTFTRLFGNPERIVGSHHVFRGRNGRTYPIALHPGAEVGVGMLLKSLRNLGVTVEDFEAAAR